MSCKEAAYENDARRRVQDELPRRHGRVKAKREAVVITKHGKPVAMLVPVKTSVDDIFGFFRNRGRITGDVVSPVLSEDEWGEFG